MLYVAEMVCKTAKWGVREWGVMEDSAVPSNLSVPKVSDSDRAATSARAKKSPKPGVQLFRMKRGRNKGFYSQKCEVEVSIALCFEWAGCLVPRDALPSVHNIVARTEHCVQRTLPVRTIVGLLGTVSPDGMPRTSIHHGHFHARHACYQEEACCLCILFLYTPPPPVSNE